MANLNQVNLIGRLTRDPETKDFAGGGRVASFGFAVNNRKKGADGQWADEPVWLDIKAFNRQTGGRQLADLVEQYLHKGDQAYLQGHLHLEQWTDKEGQKRQKLVIVLDEVQFLGGKGGAAKPEAAAQQPEEEEGFPF